jgi:riboflavin biosynthesis pyrimidine reductase
MLSVMHRLVAGEQIADVLEPYDRVDRRDPADPDRPWVLANMVGGLDGSAAFGGRVGPLSAGADAELFRRLRAVADVVLVGAATVRLEGYGPVRLPDELRDARRAAGRSPTPPLAIVTRSLDLDWTGSRAFVEAEPGAEPIVVTCGGADPDRLASARAHAGDVVVAGDERVDLAAALGGLAARGHRVVLCEGGPTLLGELVEVGLLDELCLTIAPLMGGDELPIAVSPNPGHVTALRLAHTLVDGDTLFLRYERDPRQGETGHG